MISLRSICVRLTIILLIDFVSASLRSRRHQDNDLLDVAFSHLSNEANILYNMLTLLGFILLGKASLSLEAEGYNEGF